MDCSSTIADHLNLQDSFLSEHFHKDYSTFDWVEAYLDSYCFALDDGQIGFAAKAISCIIDQGQLVVFPIAAIFDTDPLTSC